MILNTFCTTVYSSDTPYCAKQSESVFLVSRESPQSAMMIMIFLQKSHLIKNWPQGPPMSIVLLPSVCARAHACVGLYLRGGGGFFCFLKSGVDLHMFRNRTSIQISLRKSPPYLTVIMECVTEIKNAAEIGTSHQKCPLFCKSARIANMSLYLHMQLEVRS